MDVDGNARASRGTRQAVVDPVLVDVPGYRHQVGEHGVADRRGDFSIRQRIQADIDHGALPDDLHPVEDRARVRQVGVIRRQELGDLAAGELFQQRQQRCNDLVEVGLVVAHRRAQAIEHRVVVARLGEVLLQRHHTLLAPDHVPWDVLLVELGLDLDDHLPGLGLGLGEVVLGVLHEQRVDVDYVPLDQHVVRALPQFHQCARNDVDEAPCELAERCTVALAGELPGNARGDFTDASEAPHRVVACRELGPAEVKDVELALATRSLGFDVHAFQEIRVALGVDDDHDLMLTVCIRATDVLGDEQLGQPRLPHARGAQHQRMADALTQWQADVDLVGFDAVQSRQAAYRWQWPHGVE